MYQQPARRLFAGAAALGLLLPASAASAQDAAETDVSFEVADYDGDLFLEVAGTEATLTADGGGLLDAGGGDVVSGDLPTTTVTDQRGGLSTNWSVSVTGTDLQHTSYEGGTDGFDMAELIVSAEHARVFLPVTDLSVLTNLTGMSLGGGTLEGDTGANLGEEYPLVQGTTLLGNGTFTYTPRMEVDVPDNTPGGTYTGTVTQTVS
jgi:hypothetical protein